MENSSMENDSMENGSMEKGSTKNGSTENGSMENGNSDEKKKIELNISVLFVLGIILLVFGMNLFFDGIIIRQNLRNVHTDEIELSKLKEGEYLSVDKIRVFGGRMEGSSSFVVHAYVNISAIVYDYYIINLHEDDSQSISLMISERQFGELDDYVNEEGVLVPSDNWGGRYNIFTKSLDFKVVEADGEHIMNMQHAKEFADGLEDGKEIEFCSDIALVPVNFRDEEMVLTKAWYVLAAAVLLIIASKPWKMVEVRYIQQAKWNLVYRERPDDDDIRVVSSVARSLRIEIDTLRRQFDKMKNKMKKNGVTFAISVLIFILLLYMMYEGDIGYMSYDLGVLMIIPFALLLKLLVSVWIYFMNQDTYLTRNIMHFVRKEPIGTVMNDRQVKLNQGDAILSSALKMNRESDYYGIDSDTF